MSKPEANPLKITRHDKLLLANHKKIIPVLQRRRPRCPECHQIMKFIPVEKTIDYLAALEHKLIEAFNIARGTVYDSYTGISHDEHSGVELLRMEPQQLYRKVRQTLQYMRAARPEYVYMHCGHVQHIRKADLKRALGALDEKRERKVHARNHRRAVTKSRSAHATGRTRAKVSHVRKAHASRTGRNHAPGRVQPSVPTEHLASAIVASLGSVTTHK
jgi:hypothetical protein